MLWQIGKGDVGKSEKCSCKWWKVKSESVALMLDGKSESVVVMLNGQSKKCSCKCAINVGKSKQKNVAVNGE